tara:strand:- start:18 stop:353 length:336 start_codon:yes stop_codon:yes gene_type:complete
MSKEDILSELKQILDDANGYDIDPYIIHKLIEKNEVSREYTIENYERFNNEKGEILSLNKKDNNCEDIEKGDTLILDVGRYRAVEVEHFKAFNGGKGQNVLVLIKLITIND